MAQARPGAVGFEVSPRAQFIAPGSAVISWETSVPCATILEYGEQEGPHQRLEQHTVTKAHRATLGGLEPGVRYVYRVLGGGAQETVWASDFYELDNALNYAVVPIPDLGAFDSSGGQDQTYRRAADYILAKTGVTKGYCVVLGFHEGRLACELARRSELIVLGVDDDQERVQRVRARLRQAGLYGPRITLHPVDSFGRLPLPASFANLVVSDELLGGGDLPGTAEQVAALLQPATGVACLGYAPAGAGDSAKERLSRWLGSLAHQGEINESAAGTWVTLRPQLPTQTGSWTHQYGDAGNTASSREGLQGATGTDQLEVRWLGRPGADFGLDRNPRMPAPLAIGGRLFHQGMNRMIALDSYNGAVLWSLEIPALRRVNMPRDCGNWCADADALYVAVENRCWVIEAATGQLLSTRRLAQADWHGTHQWGYVAQAGDLLYGSSVRRGAVYTNFWGRESWYDQTGGHGTEPVCSDDLFACAKKGDQVVWRYAGGLILNPTLAVAANKVFFVECRHPEVKQQNRGRIGSEELWQDQFLVALEARTSAPLWQHPLAPTSGAIVLYLVGTEDAVFVVASVAGKYRIDCYGAGDGQHRWHAEHDWPSDNHGGHLQHPVVVGDTIFLEPCGYDLATGKLKTNRVGRHEGCATYAAALGALLYRGESRRIALWDIATGAVTSWYNLRPSCWLSTIPANGMILAPEGGGGCSCGNWLETSIGFAPAPGSGHP